MNTKISDAVMVYFKRKGSASEDRIPAISVESCCVDPELITRVLPLHLAADSVPVAHGWLVARPDVSPFFVPGTHPHIIEAFQSELAVQCGTTVTPVYTHPQPAALNEVPTMDDAVAAGDGTLHGAIDHWQDRALKAEAALREVSGNSGELGGDERARFEAWGAKYLNLARYVDMGDVYCDERTKTAWAAWKAALAATGKQPLQVGEAQGIDLSSIATRKLAELAEQGYVTNGVAIFNPTTGQRGLVDSRGFVGWQGEAKYADV